MKELFLVLRSFLEERSSDSKYKIDFKSRFYHGSNTSKIDCFNVNDLVFEL